jgi:hydrogenase nickel incorporation protein HypA/HybF
MHELSICQALLRSVEAVAREHRARAVLAIELDVGALAGVEPALLESAFSIARAGTLAQAARLSLRSLPVRVRCLACGQETETAPNRLLCEACGSWNAQVVQGQELLLRNVELELEEERIHV